LCKNFIIGVWGGETCMEGEQQEKQGMDTEQALDT
jgi:hypothetical protein